MEPVLFWRGTNLWETNKPSFYHWSIVQVRTFLVFWFLEGWICYYHCFLSCEWKSQPSGLWPFSMKGERSCKASFACRGCWYGWGMNNFKDSFKFWSVGLHKPSHAECSLHKLCSYAIREKFMGLENLMVTEVTAWSLVTSLILEWEEAGTCSAWRSGGSVLGCNCRLRAEQWLLYQQHLCLFAGLSAYFHASGGCNQFQKYQEYSFSPLVRSGVDAYFEEIA